VPDRVVRILSDLHYRDRTGLQSLDALEPLLDGATELILNGDSLEARHPSSRALEDELRCYFLKKGMPVTFLAGNHDPAISESHERILAHGRIWVTHGDLFWDNAAPWSRYAKLMAELIAEERLIREITPQSGDLSDFFAAHRAAHLRCGVHHDPSNRSLRARLAQLIRTLLPPKQMLRMIQAWRQAPEHAFSWAKKHRPKAQFILFGHIHYPAVWRDRTSSRIAINTGSFEWPFRGWCVDVSDQSLTVRGLVRQGDRYRLGPTKNAFPLAK